MPIKYCRKKKRPSFTITMEPRINNLRYNDIPGITINNRCPAKVIVKCMGQNPVITIFDITIFPAFNDGNIVNRAQIFPVIAIKPISLTTGSAYIVNIV